MKIGVKIPRSLANPVLVETLKSKSLAIASIVGNCVSTYLFTKRAYDFKEKIEATDEDDILKETVKTFSLPVIIFIGANACTLYSSVVSEKTVAGLIAANAYTANKLQTYRKEVENRLGEDTEHDIHRVATIRDIGDYEMFDDVIVYSTTRYDRIVNNLPGGRFTLWSQWHKDYFEVTGTQVLTAMICAKDSYALQGFLFVNQLFAYLDIPQLEEFNMFGWDMMDGYNTIDLEIHKLKGEDVYYIYSLNDPDVAIPMDE